MRTGRIAGSPTAIRIICARLRGQPCGALRVDRIDLYQMHRLDTAVPGTTRSKTWKSLQAEGKTRNIGLSEVDVAPDSSAPATIVPSRTVPTRYKRPTRARTVLDSPSAKASLIPMDPLAAGALTAPAWPRSIASADRLGITPHSWRWRGSLPRSPVLLPFRRRRWHTSKQNIAAGSVRRRTDVAGGSARRRRRVAQENRET